MECLLVSTDIDALRVDSCLNIPLYRDMNLDTPRLNIPLYMECLLVSTDIDALRVDSCLNIPLYRDMNLDMEWSLVSTDNGSNSRRVCY